MHISVAFFKWLVYNLSGSFPGVAQLVGRLVWDQDAASSSLATRTKNKREAFASLLFLVWVRDSNSKSQYAGGILLPPVQKLVATFIFALRGENVNDSRTGHFPKLKHCSAPQARYFMPVACF